MTDVFVLYEALWRTLEGLGVAVVYGGLWEEDGDFHPDPWETGKDSPKITISRPYYADPPWPNQHRNRGGSALPPPDLLLELVTLAHEGGHFLSWKERTPRSEWQRYFGAAKKRDQIIAEVPRGGSTDEYNDRLRAAMQSSLRAEQIELILTEEALAWRIAQELLAGVGFDDFEYYEAAMRKGLHCHRYRLGLDELWPEDRASNGGAA
ncbi:MAG: hypothetical protein JW940_19365 [Polyangiaceae bacterium]|nr:hypothetical protein [Polyangiaceae bacterium]